MEVKILFDIKTRTLINNNTLSLFTFANQVLFTTDIDNNPTTIYEFVTV